MVQPVAVLPFLSASLWFALAGRLVHADRFRTWTEVLLLATFFGGGMFVFSDFLFFNSGSAAEALMGVRLGLSCLSFTAVAFLLYCVAVVSRMRTRYLLAFGVSGLSLVPIWSFMIVGMVPVPVGIPPYVAVYNRAVFLAWAGFLLACVAGGTVLLLRLSGRLAKRGERAAAQVRNFAVVWLLIVFIGAATNTLRGLVDARIPPLFGMLTAIPAVLAFRTAAPASGADAQDAIRRWKASRYRVDAAFLVHRSGTLIGSESRPGVMSADPDVFVATLDAIMNFVRVTWSGASPAVVSSVRVGERSVFFERRGEVYLVLLIDGEGTDPLRRQMRDRLGTFETANRDALRSWSGAVAEVQGAAAVLAEFVPTGASGGSGESITAPS